MKSESILELLFVFACLGWGWGGAGESSLNEVFLLDLSCTISWPLITYDYLCILEMSTEKRMLRFRIGHGRVEEG